MSTDSYSGVLKNTFTVGRLSQGIFFECTGGKILYAHSTYTLDGVNYYFAAFINISADPLQRRYLNRVDCEARGIALSKASGVHDD